MRCRAWLNDKFCRNSTNGTFCHVHRHLCEYPALIQRLPAAVLAIVAVNLKIDMNLQHFRRTCKTMHGSIWRVPFEFSSEYNYFKCFFSKTHLTVRTVMNASARYQSLNTNQQDILTRIPRHVRSIQARSYRDMTVFNSNWEAFNQLMSTKRRAAVRSSSWTLVAHITLCFGIKNMGNILRNEELLRCASWFAELECRHMAEQSNPPSETPL